MEHMIGSSRIIENEFHDTKLITTITFRKNNARKMPLAQDRFSSL